MVLYVSLIGGISVGIEWIVEEDGEGLLIDLILLRLVFFKPDKE
jgi:hypothetical protein